MRRLELEPDGETYAALIGVCRPRIMYTAVAADLCRRLDSQTRRGVADFRANHQGVPRLKMERSDVGSIISHSQSPHGKGRSETLSGETLGGGASDTQRLNAHRPRWGAALHLLREMRQQGHEPDAAALAEVAPRGVADFEAMRKSSTIWILGAPRTN